MRERNVRIVAAREAAEPVRETAKRGGVSVCTVSSVQNARTAQTEQPPKPAKSALEPEPPLPILKPEHIVTLKTFERPSLVSWSDVVCAAEKFTEALEEAERFDVFRPCDAARADVAPARTERLHPISNWSPNATLHHRAPNIVLCLNAKEFGCLLRLQD